MTMKAILIKKSQQRPTPKPARKRAAKSVRRGGPAVDPREVLTGERRAAVDPRAAFNALFKKEGGK